MDGSKALMIKANNTDVVVIAISVMKSLNEPGKKVDCIWSRRKFSIDSSAGTGNHNRSRESQ